MVFYSSFVRNEYNEGRIFNLIMLGYFRISGPGSVVGIVTVYGLDGQGIESPWRRDFLHLSRPAPEAHTAYSAVGA